MHLNENSVQNKLKSHRDDIAMATAAWRLSRKRSRKCMHPCCKNDSVIDSHSLTQNHCLKAIAGDGWVYQPVFRDSGKILRRSYSDGRIYPSFGKIEISKASVFNWYCAVHDSQLFKHIDVERLEYNNQEQARELYLRAMSRNIANLADCAICVEEYDRMRSQNGFRDTDEISATVLAYESDMAHLWYPYWDTDIADTVKYYWREISGNLGVAVSAMYPMAGEDNASQWYYFSGARPMIALSIIPQINDVTHIVFAWWYEWDDIMQSFISRIDDCTDDKFLYVVNQIVIKEVDGCCISPKVWAILTANERRNLEMFQQSDTCHDKMMQVPSLVSLRNVKIMREDN